MTEIYTHYDNLRVARGAPPEVIRAAYRALSQKYHPDQNPNNADATRIMAIINKSYEVLADPVRRREHDDWIARQEQAHAEAAQASHAHQPKERPPTPPPSALKSMTRDVIAHVFRNWRGYGLASFFFWIWANDKPREPTPAPKYYRENPAPARTAYFRPLTAPNGQPWPISADYISGYEILRADGLSTVTVDNSRNSSSVFVKLVSLDGAQAYPVRQFYIPAFASFTLKKVTKGSYDIRYRDHGDGTLARSEPFKLSEIETLDGTQYSNITMTLYKVQNGNMHTYAISEAEF